MVERFYCELIRDNLCGSTIHFTFSGKLDKTNRHRPSRWQEPEIPIGTEAQFPLKPFNYGQDQDMRINRYMTRLSF